MSASWSRWFAWFPVKPLFGGFVWLQFVERRRYHSGYNWAESWFIYRTLDKSPEIEVRHHER